MGWKQDLMGEINAAVSRKRDATLTVGSMEQKGWGEDIVRNIFSTLHLDKPIKLGFVVRFTVRRKVLDMSYEMWKRLDEVYKCGPADEATFSTTSEEFLDRVGLPNGLGAYYSPEERDFFEEIYRVERGRRDVPEQAGFSMSSRAESAAGRTDGTPGEGRS